MNPITIAKNLKKMTERDLEMGTAGTSASWHNMYKDSAWIFVGGLDYDLTEGDIITVFSQYGEVVNINLIRDRNTGKSKGFAFLCYEDQRSTILAVDNLNTIKVAGKIIRVDHVEQYKVPKLKEDMDEETLKLYNEGCAPKPVMINPVQIKHEKEIKQETKHKKSKRSKEKKKKHKKHRRSSSSSSSRSRSRSRSPVGSKSRKDSHDRHRRH